MIRRRLSVALPVVLTSWVFAASPTGDLAEAGESAVPIDATKQPPNFVFILAEATGWSSTSVDMDGTAPSHARPSGLTPNLEKMAADGMRFSDFYAMSPRCTPSRASFVTGISPAKLRMTYQNDSGGGRRSDEAGSRYRLMKMVPPLVETTLPNEVKTTGHWLGEIGYATAHFGKWHVGRQDPTEVGFERSDGANANQGPERGTAPNPVQCMAIVDRGIDFMRTQVAAGKPFYLQLSHYGFGSEAEATPAALAKARELVPGVGGKLLGAIAGQYDMDLALGRVRDALKELGIADNTYVFFSADHGAQGGGGGDRTGGRRAANPPFAGAKGSVSEGGIRVPFIVVGPDVSGGVVSRVRATGMDLVPTLRDLAGRPIDEAENRDAPQAVEGGSLAAVLRSDGENAGKGTVDRPRDELVIHFPHYDLNNGGPASAIYLGNYKLVRNDDAKLVTLFDIVKDRSESNDIAAANAELVQAMLARLDAYLQAIDAPRATPNAKADEGGEVQAVESAPTATSRGGGQGSRGGGRRRQQPQPGENQPAAEPTDSGRPTGPPHGGAA